MPNREILCQKMNKFLSLTNNKEKRERKHFGTTVMCALKILHKKEKSENFLNKDLYIRGSLNFQCLWNVLYLKDDKVCLTYWRMSIRNLYWIWKYKDSSNQLIITMMSVLIYGHADVPAWKEWDVSKPPQQCIKLVQASAAFRHNYQMLKRTYNTHPKNLINV